ncbi:hypothetical protein H3H36_13705 [Duganella sp. FT3S]|uniref:Uncharacterized protein n=1 Tax=Rugamonas fusca TaxID=2758568 RepID=A0A7W2I7K0_9BURK|nr:cytochrome oxidase putative small subunit CydP [Rugamonas fusca]MBA5606408.1 hypothetical protein [Rugamonas fusca]
MNRPPTASRRGLPLWLAISLALVLKGALLFWLWHAFFSHPQAHHMRMPSAEVQQHLLDGAPASNPSPPTSEMKNDSAR